MKLGAPDITVTIGEERIALRPTLRAALTLDRRHGFDKLARGVVEGNVSIISSILREGAKGHCITADWLDGLSRQGGLLVGLQALQAPLLAFIFALAGVDEDSLDEADQVDDKAEKSTFADVLVKAFEIGTGWLGWPPEVVWSSTLAEIHAAQRGRVEMLKAIFGSGEDKSDELPAFNDQNVKTIFASLGAKVEA